MSPWAQMFLVAQKLTFATQSSLKTSKNSTNSTQTADASHWSKNVVGIQVHCDLFFEETFTKLEQKYWEVQGVNVCKNMGYHMVRTWVLILKEPHYSVNLGFVLKALALCGNDDDESSDGHHIQHHYPPSVSEKEHGRDICHSVQRPSLDS